MKKKIQPKLTLVGAGPGDPDLLTIKGFKAIAEADVILYDALVNKALLDYAPKKALKIFVGKRKGYHRYSQDEINELIVANALEYGHVVRLKGGDSFVFGRGSEEINYTANFNIPTTVIPGISSAIAVPANQGIPLTSRKVAQSFWVITGTTSERKLSKDVALAAKSSATVVILMGMSKIAAIVELFKKENKHDVPAAIIQNGTTPNEQYVVGNVSNIMPLAKEKQLGAPAIIIIGEVVKESHKLSTLVTQNYLQAI